MKYNIKGKNAGIAGSAISNFWSYITFILVIIIFFIFFKFESANSRVNTIIALESQANIDIVTLNFLRTPSKDNPEKTISDLIMEVIAESYPFTFRSDYVPKIDTIVRPHLPQGSARLIFLYNSACLYDYWLRPGSTPTDQQCTARQPEVHPEGIVILPFPVGGNIEFIEVVIQPFRIIP